MNEDKNTLGLTPKNRMIMEKIMDTGYFESQMAAAKLAMSIAIRERTPIGELDPGSSTIWNIGSFDEDGKIKNLIDVLYPDNAAPYRLVEYLINAGLEILGEAMKKTGSLDLEKIIST